jgi:hypothetical protein
MLKFVTTARPSRLYTCIIIRHFSRISSRYSRPKNLVSSVSSDQKLKHTPTMNDEDVIIDVIGSSEQLSLKDSHISKRLLNHPKNISTSTTTLTQLSLRHFQLPDEVSDANVLKALISARPDKQFNESLDFINRDIEDQIVAAADGDVKLALGIRNATNQRKVRVATERLKLQQLRISALKEVANEDAISIKKSFESLITSGHINKDSFELLSTTSSSDGRNAIYQLISHLQRISKVDLMNGQLASQFQSPTRQSAFTSIDALTAQTALLRGAEALAIASGADFVGPGDRGVLLEATQTLGVDVEALLTEQRESLKRRKQMSKLKKTSKNEGTDDDETNVSLGFLESTDIFDNTDDLDTLENLEEEEEDVNLENYDTSVPESLSQKLERDPIFDGLALPDYLVTQSGESLPEQRGQTDDFFNDAAIPIEIQERQAHLRKLRARSELSHAKKLLLKAISASMRSEHKVVEIGVSSSSGRDLNSNVLVTESTSLSIQKKKELSLERNLSRHSRGTIVADNQLTKEERLEQAQELLTSLGFPARDSKGRAIIPLKEDESRVIAEKKAYNRLSQRPTSQQVDTYAALRKNQAEEALAAGDEEAIVAKLLENVENEEISKGETEMIFSSGVTDENSLSLSPNSSIDLSNSPLKKPLPQKTRLSLLPDGYRNWNEVAAEATRPENAKRSSKVRAKLSSQQQQILDGTIKAPKEINVLKSDKRGETKDSLITPRQVRVASNLLGSLQYELTLLSSEITGTKKPNPHVELVEVAITPDLRKAFVRWRIPDESSNVENNILSSGNINEGKGSYSKDANKLANISFSDLVNTASPILGTDLKERRKEKVKDTLSTYSMDAPSSSSARWLLNSQLRKEKNREESYARAHRRPKKQDLYLLHREIDPTLKNIEGRKELVDEVTSFLERRAGALRRAVATRLKLRFTPKLEFHKWMGKL